jgi:3',5'-cyclic AMP phosphodiesterase CpdA
MGENGDGVLSRRKFLLGMAGLSLSLSFGEAHAYTPFEPFTFAFVTDIHLVNGKPDSYKLLQESQLFLQQLVKELNDEPIDFIMFGGDQCENIGRDQANWQLFLDCIQGLNAPWSFILGEQDISGDYGVDKMKTFGPDWKSRNIETTTPYWAHTMSQNPGVHVIGLDTTLPNTTTGGVSPRQLEWLKKDLTANKKLFTIVFAHHPLLPPPPFDGGPPFEEYVIPDGGAVREVLAGFPQVKMVISGHVHVSKVQQEGNIWHISSPSLDVYPCAYRVFRVTPDAVTMETRQIGFPALVKRARKLLIDSNLASKYERGNPEAFVELVEGAREDSDALISFVGKGIQPINKKKREKEKEDKRDKKEEKRDKQKEKEEKKQEEERQKQEEKDRKRQEAEEAKQARKKPASERKAATKSGTSSSSKSGTSKSGTSKTKGKPEPLETIPESDIKANPEETPAPPEQQPESESMPPPPPPPPTPKYDKKRDAGL